MLPLHRGSYMGDSLVADIEDLTCVILALVADIEDLT